MSRNIHPRAWLYDTIANAIVARRSLAQRVVRRTGSPRLFDLYEASGNWELTAEGLMSVIAEDRVAIERSLAEARNAIAGIDEDAASAQLPYGLQMDAGGATTEFLYAAVRLRRPSVVVETGVANGRSTAAILAALDANGHGELHSFDIAPDVGVLVSDRARWTLHLVDPARPSTFESIVAGLGKIDLFFHDADHNYAPQMLEYRTVWPLISAGGILVSDDVDWSYAFLDFSKSVSVRPACLLDRRKVAGALLR